jgi:hypothetical protein
MKQIPQSTPMQFVRVAAKAFQKTKRLPGQQFHSSKITDEFQ